MSKKKKEPVEEKLDDKVESIEWREITFTCPVRGKVTQKVKVVKLKPQKVEDRNIVRSSTSLFGDSEVSELINQSLDDETAPVAEEDHD